MVLFRWTWLRLRLRLLRLGRIARRVLSPPARQVLAFWLVLAAGTGLLAVNRAYPGAWARLADTITSVWKGAAAGAGQLLPNLVDWAEAQGRLGEAALRQGLPMTVWETGPEPPPPPDWRREVRALVYALTRYDLGSPQTLLEAAIPGFAMYSQEQRRGLGQPSGPGQPQMNLVDAGDPLVIVARDAADSSVRLREPESLVRPPPVPGPEGPAPPLPPEATPAPQAPPPGPAGPAPGPHAPGPAPPAERGAFAEPAVPLDWRERLRAVQWGEGCRILIYHTHTSETYRTGSFAPARADAYHIWNTTETGIVEVGRALRRRLEEVYGIPVCHALDIHDWPSHPRAYIEARDTVQQVLARNPNVEIVLDVHRDAPEGLVATVAGQPVAQVALVVGTNAAMHPGWRANLAFAQQLAARIQARWPGVFRRVIERPDSRLNQDLHPRAVLVEVGSYDNHLDEALRTAELLADVLAEMLAEIIGSDADAGTGGVR